MDLDTVNQSLTSVEHKPSNNDESGDLCRNDSSTLRRIISVRSEASVVAQVSKRIEDLSKSKELLDGSDKAELANQVRLGEITPFQASAKVIQNQNDGSTFNKTTQLLDLERYIFQQAELGRRKAILPCKKKRSLPGKETATVSRKKQKLNSNSKFIDNLKEKKLREPVIVNGDSVSKSTTQRSTSGCNNTTSSVSTRKNRPSIDTESEQQASTSKTGISAGFDGTDAVNISKDCSGDSDPGSEYLPSDEQPDSGDDDKKSLVKKNVRSSKTKTGYSKLFLDDGDEWVYRQRVETSGCSKYKQMHKVDNLFRVPMYIWKRLYRYQKVSVQWLWELHGRNLGGLLGDEMGLGKTVQLIAFLAGLDCSELLLDGGRFRGLGPSLIICPATLLEQWVKHFHEWWPTLRVATLHHMGTYKGDPEQLVHSLKCGGILITSYTGVLIHKELLVNMDWHYVILDEGHKIRNPEAKVTKAVKQFSTPHRIILTGSPMQNSLKELWSLFDFILPGKLGTLPAFMEHFAAPITRGGYTNASSLQEATALNVATMLNDAIAPYMLRRTKTDVQHHVSLPEKNEQVLFCSLTDEQRSLYKGYLRSGDVSFVLHERSGSAENGRYRARLLVALSALRKICNHPDLYLYDNQADAEEYRSGDEAEVTDTDVENFGYWKRAGKMAVVRSLLKIWKKQGHRVLLFTQSRQMLAVLETLVQREKYSYLRMDGTTPMSQRQQDVDKFNNDPSYFVFILTTRVGGLGINLTGANRVVIYDPDWNPATDAQARERAWRIGQEKNVTIYRLITAGTIEEKIYHRQIFKQLLSIKVLEDPRQRRLFRTSDLTELLSLNEPIGNDQTESEKLFCGSESPLGKTKPSFSSEKLQAMRKLAACLSKGMRGKTADSREETIEKKEANCGIDSGKIKNSKARETPGDGESQNSSNNAQKSPEGSFKNSSYSTTANSVSLAIESVEDEHNLSLERPKAVSEQIEQGDTDAELKLATDASQELHKPITLEEEIDTQRKIGYNPLVDVESEPHDDASSQQSVDTEPGGKNIKYSYTIPFNLNAEGKSPAALIVESNRSESAEFVTHNSSDCPEMNDDKSRERKLRQELKHRRKRSRKKNDREISSLFEGKRVSCLIGRRLGNSTVEKSPPSDDNYVLRKLFAKSTVSTAFQHESILSGVRYSNPNLMQRQAHKAAEESMEQLRQSRKWCQKPTWSSVSGSND